MDDKKPEVGVLVAVFEVNSGDEVCPGCGAEPEARTSSGVTTNAYRRGWDGIFGKKTEVGEA